MKCLDLWIRKLIAFTLLCAVCTQAFPVRALEITDIRPDDSYVLSLGRDVEADKECLRAVANSYGARYVVTEEKYIDISAIDHFYSELSAPLILAELDEGKVNVSFDKIRGAKLQKQMKDFKVLGGLAGYSAEFEPVSYFNIYRGVSLVGGYVKYNKADGDPYGAYWRYVCGIEDMTKEVVPYQMRMKLIERIKSLSDFMDTDTAFKIFLLKDGQIDSIYEREGI